LHGYILDMLVPGRSPLAEKCQCFFVMRPTPNLHVAHVHALPISCDLKFQMKKKLLSINFVRVVSLTSCVFALLATTLPEGVHAQSAQSGSTATMQSTDSGAASNNAGTLGIAPALAKKTELGENPYGIKAVWAQGDFVARATLLILLVMSMSSWYIVVTKLLEQAKLNRQAAAVQDSFWQSASVRQSTDTLAVDSPFRFIAEKALDGASQHAGLLGAIDFNTWVTMNIQRAMTSVQSRLQNGLALLATVGSTAPFVGLFGTVWGIYHALVSIGMSGQASIDKVAGPVGESLIMTAIGLAVAVPAVLGYNWLVRRNKIALESVHAFGNDLHGVLLATAGK
jgi:biopolymer transport protein ExbB